VTAQAVPLATAPVALRLYAKGFLRLHRRRPDLARPWQALAFAAGVALALAAVLSPLDEVAETRLLSAHMAQHLLLGDIAPLLLVLGLRGPLALFALPPELLGPLARSPLRRLAARALQAPVALALWAATLYLWHVPWLYETAVANPLVHAVEHASLLATGLLVWTVVLDPLRSPGRRAAFAAAVLVTGMPLAEMLIASSPLYPHYETVDDRPFGLTAATDQARAGHQRMAEQSATLGTAAALLLWSHAEAVATEAQERGVTR
jgi:cytochrome c oxidase assembly factor CtaG